MNIDDLIIIFLAVLFLPLAVAYFIFGLLVTILIPNPN